MRSATLHIAFLAAVLVVAAYPTWGVCGGEVLDLTCRSCGYRTRLAQGFDPEEESRNVQTIIVVCERSHEIRTIKIPLDPKQPVTGEPLLGRQYGMGRSELLGIRLPRFLVPGNTCPLFPVTAYLQHNVCPVDGGPGFSFSVVGYF